MQDIPPMPGPMVPVPLLKLIFALPFPQLNRAKNAHLRQFGSRTFILFDQTLDRDRMNLGKLEDFRNRQFLFVLPLRLFPSRLLICFL